MCRIFDSSCSNELKHSISCNYDIKQQLSRSISPQNIVRRYQTLGFQACKRRQEDNHQTCHYCLYNVKLLATKLESEHKIF